MDELIEFEVEFIYLSKKGKRPKPVFHFVDVWAKDQENARKVFWKVFAPALTDDESFVWITGLTRIPQA